MPMKHTQDARGIWARIKGVTRHDCVVASVCSSSSSQTKIPPPHHNPQARAPSKLSQMFTSAQRSDTQRARVYAYHQSIKINMQVYSVIVIQANSTLSQTETRDRATGPSENHPESSVNKTITCANMHDRMYCMSSVYKRERNTIMLIERRVVIWLIAATTTMSPRENCASMRHACLLACGYDYCGDAFAALKHGFCQFVGL